MTCRIAYLINQYPQVSHSFVRREILALERQGLEIQRLALRGWDARVVDPADQREQGATRYALRGGLLPLLFAALAAAIQAPRRFLAALILALKMARPSDRSLFHHLAYLAEACRFLPWLKKFGARHIHAHFGTNSAEVAMLLATLAGGSYSFTVHGPEEFDKPQFLGLPEKMRRAAFVVAISSYCRGQLYRWLEADLWPKIEEVHCGLEGGFHRLAPTPPTHPRRLVCVGRLCEQKGQLLLIEAARRLAQRGVDFELVLAGDGEMLPRIVDAIVRQGLGERVRITGWIGSDQVREELLAARALVLPSFAEGLPVVIMEALALGRPVITTAIAGIPELVRDGENGWLIPAGSIEDLVEAMAACLAQPLETIEAMGEAGRARVLERHAVDVEAARLAELFRRAGPPRPAPAAETPLPVRPAEGGL